jgi:hypothetical protein
LVTPGQYDIPQAALPAPLRPVLKLSPLASWMSGELLDPEMDNSMMLESNYWQGSLQQATGQGCPKVPPGALSQPKADLVWESSITKPHALGPRIWNLDLYST